MDFRIDSNAEFGLQLEYALAILEDTTGAHGIYRSDGGNACFVLWHKLILEINSFIIKMQSILT